MSQYITVTLITDTEPVSRYTNLMLSSERIPRFTTAAWQGSLWVGDLLYFHVRSQCDIVTVHHHGDEANRETNWDGLQLLFCDKEEKGGSEGERCRNRMRKMEGRKENKGERGREGEGGKENERGRGRERGEERERERRRGRERGEERESEGGRDTGREGGEKERERVCDNEYIMAKPLLSISTYPDTGRIVMCIRHVWYKHPVWHVV